MTSQTGRGRVDVRRAVIGGVLALGLTTGFGVSTAFAQPAQPTETDTPTASDTRQPGENCTGEDCAKPVAGSPEASGEGQTPMTADQALMIIHNEYALGDGGGQLSQLIDDVMSMRAQGFKPNSANKQAIQDALDDRPNQKPLVEALQSTLAYQRKIQAQQQMAAQQQGPQAGPVPVIPPGQNAGTPPGQGRPGTVNIPLG